MSNYRAIYHQTLSTIPVCLGEFSLGLVCGWIAPMIKTFLEDPDSEVVATEEECSWIASLTEFGRIFGPLSSLLLLDIIGRKSMLQISSIIFFVVWVAILFTRSPMVLCATFFVFGLGVGICNSASAVYLGENSSPTLRGIFCSITATAFYVGVLVQYIIAGYLSYHNLSVANIIMAFVSLASTLFLVESSQFLMLRDRFDRAEKNMMWLRGTSNKEDIMVEFEDIKSNIASEKLKKTSYKELFTSTANYKSLIIVLVMNMAHAATGNAVMFTYISVIFPENDFFTSNQVTVYFGVSQMTLCLLGSLIIENYNRRTLTLLCYAIFILCHVIASYFLYDAVNNETPVTYGVWIVFASVCIFSGFSAVLDSVIHILRGELFPQSIRPIGSALSISAHSFIEFLTVKIFLSIKSQYGTHVNFLGYAVVSLISFLFSYFALPETRGKTLIEIQKMLERSK
ncbi:facilitated trehalose transporter Tret1-like [Planococcus citri]|uniref:facilitated trehalose transporter Tret1-like n=1 Tax=Planococcus citri TaxID=170843 RepID=UPI0031F9BB13